MDRQKTPEQLEQKVLSLEVEVAELRWAQKKAYLMQQCLNNIGDAVYWLDGDGNVIYVNGAVENHFGFSPSGLLSRKIFAVMLQEQQDTWPDFFTKIIKQERFSCNSTSRTSSGGIRSVEISFSRLQYKGKEVVQAHVVDISRFHEVNESLEKLQSELQGKTGELADVFEQQQRERNDWNRQEKAFAETIRSLETELFKRQETSDIAVERLAEESGKRAEIEHRLEEIRADYELLSVMSDLDQEVENRKVKLAETSARENIFEFRDQIKILEGHIVKQAEQKHELEKRIEELSGEIGVQEKYQEELEEFQRELERITHAYTDEVSSLRVLLTRKEDVLKQLLHQNNNALGAITTFFTEKAQKVKKKNRLKVIGKHKNALYLFSFIQEQLYQPEYPLQDGGNVYIDDVVHILNKYGWSEAENIRFSVAVGRVPVNADRAICVGLIVYELVENSLFHAFQGKKKGKIKISMEQSSPEEVELIVKDNGSGLAEDFDPETCQSSGLPFVLQLIRDQLQGTCRIGLGKGTTFSIGFRPHDKEVG